MSDLNWFCMTPTPFKVNGEVDEEAFRKFLHRYIDSRIGIYLGSAGTGEAHTLTPDELETIYRIGVEECKGKIPVHANLPEEHSAARTLAHIERAKAAGVEVIHLYPLEGRHSMRPKPDELMAYFDNLLSKLNHPVVLAVNGRMLHYEVSPAMVEAIARKYRQIIGVRMSDVRESYLIELKDRISWDMQYIVMLPGSISSLLLGATGVFGSEGGIIPKTIRQFLDLYEHKRYEEVATVYRQIDRFNQYVRYWGPPAPRWYKMSMRVMRLPGGEGGLREPYLLPDEAELQRFKDGLSKLGIPEIDEQLKAAAA
jgi:4-hydroxy-tetrahydrodipicolinate synthase